MKSLRSNAGLSLIEIMLVMTIFAVISLGVARSLMTFSGQGRMSTDKSFAIQKTIQMMEELRSLIAASGSDVGTLDDYDDGTTQNYILTTHAGVTDAGALTSGNGARRYYRNISVIRLPNESLARRVYIRVYRAQTGELLAETMSILRTIRNDYLPTQVLDLYVLAVENIPGWWVSLSTMKPMLDNIIQDLETRNPGLELRTHWITKTAYGRDPYYRPYTNLASPTNTTAFPWVYFYPGLMDRSGDDYFYFVPTQFKGRISIDGTLTNGSSYSIADQYNHAVRYPEEEERYAADVAAALGAGQAAPEWSLRMLLEKMNSSSEVSNALIINLHGELLPMPPMRNYSDPAKAPATSPNIRVVTHPGKLQYAAGDAVNLRVYPYAMYPDTVPESTLISTTTVVINGISIDPAAISLRRMAGSSTVDYAWSTATAGTHYTVDNSGSQTVIRIFNSPVRHPMNGSTNRGQPSADRLYGLEYIPCEVGNPGSPEFPEGVRDLAMNNPNSPKNSARWVISIAAATLPNGRYTIDTRIGNDLTTGTMANQPTNLSRTYVWVGQTPPVTEQYQFLGDPRHMPYTDVKANHGYNWFFTAVASGDYQGFTKTQNGWNGLSNMDIPRLFQMLRGGLLNTTSIWNSITGWSMYYIGVGNEMGDDGSIGFAGGLPMIETPWNPAGSAQRGVDEITAAGTYNNVRVIANSVNTWVSLSWLGELYPDSSFATWQANGNLATGAGGFYRANHTTFGGYFSYNPLKRNGEMGAPAMMNGNTSGSGNRVFSHNYSDGSTSSLLSLGSLLSQILNFPLLSSITGPRAFNLNANIAGYIPPEWNDTAYSGQRTTLASVENYFDSNYASGYNASSLISMTNGSTRSYWVMNGLGTQGDFGAADIGKLCVSSLLRGFLALGLPSITTGRIAQLPLVTITSPLITDEFNNPSTIPVTWTSQWKRWDGSAYTEGYAANFTDPSTVRYNLKYSNDNGRTWLFIQDATAASAGVYDASKAIATTSYTWNTSALSRGSYILRLEAYRSGRPLHYSYQQREVYIFR